MSLRKGALMTAAAVIALGSLTACSSGTGAGGTTDAPTDGDITIAYVPKLIGVPYFEAMKAGGEEAAADLGVTFLYEGPTTADAAGQVSTIQSLISRGVDAIAVAPNDPAVLAPVLEQAKAAGIIVYTTDADAPDSAREFFVNQASIEAIGTTVIDQVAEAAGGSGKWAIVSCGATAENLNAWIEVEKTRAEAEYPDLELVDTRYAGEDQQKAAELTRDLITANPDLKVVVGQCGTGSPGVAQAIEDAGAIGTVTSVTLGTPSSMAAYLKSGATYSNVLWNPVDLGYLTVWAGVQAAQGVEFDAENEVGGPFDAPIAWNEETKELLLGDPFIFTKDNVDEYADLF